MGRVEKIFAWGIPHSCNIYKGQLQANQHTRSGTCNHKNIFLEIKLLWKKKIINGIFVYSTITYNKRIMTNDENIFKTMHSTFLEFSPWGEWW